MMTTTKIHGINLWQFAITAQAQEVIHGMTEFFHARAVMAKDMNGGIDYPKNSHPSRAAKSSPRIDA